MPLYECVDEHWLLLVADVQHRNFQVYDSLTTTRSRVRGELITCAVSIYVLHINIVNCGTVDAAGLKYTKTAEICRRCCVEYFPEVHRCPRMGY